MSRGGVAGLLLPVVAVMAAIGCDVLPTRFVSGLSADERSMAAQIPVYHKRLPEGFYRPVGEVQGLSCQISSSDTYRASADNAIEELQRATFRAGGNAVMDVSCDHFGQRQGNQNCFRSIVCRGMAIQSKPGEGSSYRVKSGMVEV